ncbi:hypothetical protein C6P74_24650 [Burkholderia multivorans]|nr:hypothetical protein C6P74_24650 [Burkholderia multivorans]PRE75552.1 hypothetical protein C6Q02_25435 [Burkholderia multivorans]PRH11177.1 hypothetical protein C6T61_06335 [Burkholderia multivorans]
MGIRDDRPTVSRSLPLAVVPLWRNYTDPYVRRLILEILALRKLLERAQNDLAGRVSDSDRPF